MPGAAIWYEHPFASIGADQTRALLLAAGVIAAFNAVATVFFLGLWTGVLGKWGEILRTARQTRYIGKWFFLAGMIGGPMTHWGTVLAIAGAFVMFTERNEVRKVVRAVEGLTEPVWDFWTGR